jgi:exopolysaccharide biosynthesis polyprenyl glycosylphosphotransferase
MGGSTKEVTWRVPVRQDRPAAHVQPSARPEHRAIGALQARRLIDTLTLRLAPAAAAGLLAWLYLGSLGAAAIVALSMLASAQVIERSGFPLSFLPVGRIVLLATAPVLGAVGTLAIMALAGKPIAASALAVPVGSAWLALAVGAWVKSRLERAAPVRVAVVGSPELAADLREELVASGVRAFDVVGWLGPAPSAAGTGDLPRLGSSDELRAALIANGIDLVVCGSGRRQRRGAGPPSQADLAETASACLGLPVRMLSVNQFYEELMGHVPVGTIDAGWYCHIVHPQFRAFSGISKRAFDLVAASLIGLVALPLLAISALAIKLGDGGPVLFRQRRVGEHGQTFEILKLRTLTHEPQLDRHNGWALADEDRVTPIGRVLRRWHLNEFPQLWNVLRGEMSFVGPRPEEPEIVAEVERHMPHYGARHLVKPGITGWAQVRCGYAHSELGTAWKLCYDLYYVRHRSLLGDLMIAIETCVVFFQDAHRALRMPGDRFIVGEHAHG